MSAEVKLQVQGLTKRFGKRRAVDQLDLSVRAGEIMGFLGPNGAGKTTTIKMIMGFLFEDAGTIRIGPYDLRKDYEKAMGLVGGIVENPEMYTQLTGRQNLELYARLHGIKDDAVIEETIRTVQMEHRIDEKVKRYSLGMKQRTGLALALVHKPEILILDEPTNGLDPAGIRHLRDILKHLAHEEGVAVLVSSHLLTEMQLMCDRVTVIDQGRLVDVRALTDEDETDDEAAAIAAATGTDEAGEAEGTGAAVAAVPDKQARIHRWHLEIGDTTNVDAIIAGAFAHPDEALRERVDLTVEDVHRFSLQLTRAELLAVEKALLADHRAIYGVQRERASLEDVYLELTEHSQIR